MNGAKPRKSWGGFFALFLACVSGLHAQQGMALVRHAPTLNGPVNGSIQQMTAESATLNSGVSVTGDLLVPGSPTVLLNGSVNYGGTLDGTGAATPTNYTITLSSGVALRHVIRRTNAITLPTVGAPPAPAGTRNVAINSPGQSAGDFATLKNLTLNSNVGQIAVPPGTYGSFNANSGSGFTFGTAGSTAIAVYNLQSLTLNTGAQLQIVGPVSLTLANGVNLNTNAGVGTSANPGWLTVKIASGGLTLNSGSVFYGNVVAPNGTVLVGGQLVGALTADRLTVNSGGLLKVPANIPPPTVSLTAPANDTVVAAPANVTLIATASSSGGSIAKVDFYAGAAFLGTATAASYQFTWTNVAAGTYTLTARATDNYGAATTSPPITLVVDAPPEVVLTAPTAGASFFTPGSINLVATATSPAQSITAVEFYSGAVLLGTATTAPYQFSWVNPDAGNCTLSAKATDSLGISTTSTAVAIAVIRDEPPVVSLFSTNRVFPTTMPVTLSFTATDAVTTVSKLEIYRADVLVGTLTAPTSGSTWTFTEAANLPPGAYSYVARAYDTNGSFADSVPVVVTVLPVLPYASDFEASEGYVTGSLHGQQSWLVEQGEAVVTTQDAAHGNQSVQLPATSPPPIVSQDFATSPGETIEFFDFFAKPVAQADPVPTATYNVESARFGFVQSGESAALHIFRGDGAGGGTWTATPFTVPLASSAWLRLTARLDFTQKTWDIYADTRMVAADVPFQDNASTALTLFQAQGDATAISALDDIYAGPANPLFADTNNNGIDDTWETAYGLSLTTDNRNLSPSGSGVTVLQAYITGTDPNDFYNGQAPQLSIASGDNQTAPVGQFNADPLVVWVLNRAGTTSLVNAPVSFSVESGDGQLALSTADNPTLANTLNVRTTADGTARVYYQQPGIPNAAGNIRVIAGSAQVVFYSTSTGIVTDADGNGLPDAWEQQYFGHTGVDPNADSDGDGLTNTQEYAAGSNPLDYYNGNAPFPFTVDFETSEGFATGAFGGQKGWLGSAGVTISTDGQSNGALGVVIPASSSPGRIDFTPSPTPEAEKIIFANFFARPVAGDAPASSVIFDVAGARVAYLKNESEGHFYGFNGDGAGNGAWQRIEYDYTVSLDPSTGVADWMAQFGVRIDLTKKKWDLQIDGLVVAADLGLVDGNVGSVAHFTLFGSAAGDVLFDSFSIGAENPAFLDSDKDDMDDSWEEWNGLDRLHDDRDGDPDTDSLTNIHEYIVGTDPNDPDADGDELTDGFEVQHGFDPFEFTYPSDDDGDGITQIQEAINGTDPNDYYNGATPVITVLSGEGNPDGEFAVRVHKPDGTPYPNAPVSFDVPAGAAAVAANRETTNTHQTLHLRTDAEGVAKVYLRPATQ